LTESNPRVFLQPDMNIFQLYINNSEENIIVSRLLFDSPLSKIDGNFYTPKIEKLIVDLLVNRPMILPISDEERKIIAQNMIDTYTINQSTLNRYATKRNAEKIIREMQL
jgi:hypothetical protein